MFASSYGCLGDSGISAETVVAPSSTGWHGRLVKPPMRCVWLRHPRDGSAAVQASRLFASGISFRSRFGGVRIVTRQLTPSNGSNYRTCLLGECYAVVMETAMPSEFAAFAKSESPVTRTTSESATAEAAARCMASYPSRPWAWASSPATRASTSVTSI